MSIRRVTFLVPPFPGRETQDRSGLPLGPLYLSACISDTYDVHLVDAYSPPLSIEQLMEEVIRSEPDVLAVSSPFSAQMSCMGDILPAVKRELPECVIIGGGTHMSFLPDRTFDDFPYFDYLVLGDGELVFPGLLQELDDEKCQREKRQTFRDGEILKDLDSIPLPDYSILKDASSYSPRIITSRGCSHRCHFCSASAFHDGKWRAHSPERVIEEFERVISVFGNQPVSIGDDNFTADRSRVLKICELLRKKGLKLQFGISAHPDDLDTDLIKEMVSVGLNSLFLGLESGVQSVREKIGKVFDMDKLQAVLETCTECDMEVHASFMLGIPGETEADMESTLRFAEGLRATSLGFHIFNPLPGSQIFENPVEFGYKVDGDDYTDMAIDTHRRISTPDLHPIAVLDYYYRARGLARVRREGGMVS